MPRPNTFQVNIRMGSELHALLRSAADQAGESFSEYLRAAALARAVYEASQGKNPELDRAMRDRLEYGNLVPSDTRQ